MVDRAPLENLMLLAFRPSNVQAVSTIMHNPMRDLGVLHIGALESLGTSLISTQGDPAKLPIAFGMFLMERLEDPIKLASTIMMAGKKG
jgi:hypothetical protein